MTETVEDLINQLENHPDIHKKIAELESLVKITKHKSGFLLCNEYLMKNFEIVSWSYDQAVFAIGNCYVTYNFDYQEDSYVITGKPKMKIESRTDPESRYIKIVIYYGELSQDGSYIDDVCATPDDILCTDLLIPKEKIAELKKLEDLEEIISAYDCVVSEENFKAFEEENGMSFKDFNKFIRKLFVSLNNFF